MIPLKNPALYAASLQLLRDHTHSTGSYQGRLVQIFLAAKFAGGSVPAVGSGLGLGTGELQATLDDLYTKKSRRAAGEPSVVSLFSNEHLYPTGVKAGTLKAPSNIWRNNFQLQKAMVCYASEAELSNPAFFMAERAVCPHLLPSSATPAGGLKEAACSFKPNTHYRNEDRAKFMRRDPVTEKISVVDPSNLSLWQNAVVPTAGKLPAPALVCALYHDAAIAAGRSGVDLEDFLLDFNFSPAEFHALFDDDATSTANANLAGAFSSLTWTGIAKPPVATGTSAATSLPTPTGTAAASVASTKKAPAAKSPPAATPSPVLPPTGSHWWAAEQAVQQAFKDAGWAIIDRSRQGVGFDFEASKAGVVLYIEVKSSVAGCSPVMTDKEFKAAKEFGQDYVLAVIENYHPTATLEILWVRNPALLQVTQRTAVEYLVPRSRWRKATTNIGV